jgi:outer membrane protein OmpA-like peptidoglycan-associated protein
MLTSFHKKTLSKLAKLAMLIAAPALLNACAIAPPAPPPAIINPYPIAGTPNAISTLGSATGVQTGTQTAIGAALGAGLGNLIGGNRQGTLIGAAIGAGLGYQYGDYIRQSLFGLNQSGVMVDTPAVASGTPAIALPVRITLPEYSGFEPSSAQIRYDAGSAGNNTLNQISQTLRNANYQYATILVVGHTDSSGNVAINNQLSIDRAVAVANYLAKQGLDSRRIRAEGRGAAQPIADNMTIDGRARNRRVEIIVMPTQG